MNEPSTIVPVVLAVIVAAYFLARQIAKHPDIVRRLLTDVKDPTPEADWPWWVISHHEARRATRLLDRGRGDE